MHKKTLPALALTLALVLSGCGNHAPITTTSQSTSVPPADTTSSTEETLTDNFDSVVMSKSPLTSISLTSQVETLLDDAGNTLFSYTYPNVQLVMADGAAAETITLKLLNQIDSTRSAAQAIAQSLPDSATASNGFTPYFFTYQLQPGRIDLGVLSLFGKRISYSGIGHPEYAADSVTYDLVTGEELTLGDILYANCTPDILTQLVTDSLETLEEDAQLYPEYRDLVADRFSGGYLGDNGWYLSQEGLCIYFSPYEIAPYAAGIVTAVIPYRELSGLLMDEYFPLETAPFRGEMMMANFDSSPLRSVAQYADLILDSNGQRLLLYPSAQVYDVRIQAVAQETTTLFAAYSLETVQAIFLQADLSDPETTLVISWFDGVDTQVRRLTAQGLVEVKTSG